MGGGVILLAAHASNAADAVRAFPPAGEGRVRYVLQRPGQVEESLLKVELIVGKTVEVDAHNRFFFGGRIEAETIVGWGYTRYVVNGLGPMAGTLMAVDPNAAKVPRFLTLSGDAYLIRYSSQLPVVVYVPEGVEVRYRIRSTEAGGKTIDKG